MTVSAPPALVEPAYLHVPEYAITLGPEVADLARLANFPADPEQELILDAMFAEKETGEPAADEVDVIAARQNIKTGALKIACLGWLYVLELRLIIWSAHEFAASREAFRDLDELIAGAPSLSRQVERTNRSHGEEAIELYGNRRVLFKARSKGAGRALSADRTVLDEAYALQSMHMGALLPTMSARPGAQLVLASSACRPESAVLRDHVARGRAGTDPTQAYLEWCAPPAAQACDDGDGCDHAKGHPGCGCDKPELWMRANTAVTRGRMKVATIASERRKLPVGEFMRERMGWHDLPIVKVEEAPPIDADRWADLEDPRSRLLRVGAFAIEVSLDRTSTTIVAAGPAPVSLERGRPTGRVHVEVVQDGRGTGWVLAQCLELDATHGPAPFVLDAGGPAAVLIEPLREAGLDVVEYGARDVARAAAGLVDAVNQGLVTHGPDGLLAAAVEGAKRRPLGDGGFAFGRRSSTEDVTPLVAASLAYAARDELDYDVMDSIG